MSRKDTERYAADLVEGWRAERVEIAALIERARASGTELSESDARRHLARKAYADKIAAQVARLDEEDRLHADLFGDERHDAEQPGDDWWTPWRRKAHDAYAEAVRWCRVNLARGPSYSSVSKRLGIHRHTLRSWIEQGKFEKLEDVAKR